MDSLPIINKTYEAYKDIIELHGKLEKRWKYSLGIGLENSILDFIESLVMAKSAPKTLKAAYLLKGMGKLEISILQLQAKLAEIGRMLGGWLKSTQS